MAQKKAAMNLAGARKEILKLVNNWPSTHPLSRAMDLKAIILRRLNTQWSPACWNEKDAVETLHALRAIDQDICRHKYPLKTGHTLMSVEEANEILFRKKQKPLEALYKFIRTGKAE